MVASPSAIEELRRAAGGESPDPVEGAPKPKAAQKQGINEVSVESALSSEANFDHEKPPEWLAHYMKEGWSIAKQFPPLEWVPRYMRSVRGQMTKEDERKNGMLPFSPSGDVVAGLTVGIMLVPQSLAFALLAGLPVQIGLYSSFLPLVAYACMGTIRQVQPGPTALVSLLSGQALDSLGLDTELQRIMGASFMALIVGLISVLLGLLRTGFIVDFMSHSVMSAFCTAAGITIGTSQVKYLFGLHLNREKYWWKTAKGLIVHMPEVHGPSVAMGFTLLSLLLTLKYWKSAGNKERRSKHPLWRFFPQDKTTNAFRGLKLVADLSSLLCVTVGWMWGAIYRSAGVEGIQFVGDVDSSGLVLALPGGGDWGRLMGGGGSIFINAAIIAVVGFLETMAVGGKFAAAARYSFDPNQELIALGVANVFSGFSSGYPVTGSFTRTAVNAQFGATSLFSCALASLLVLLAAYILLPVIALLPLGSLAPIIIQGAIGVVNFGEFKKAYQSKPPEVLVMLATLVVSLALTVKEGLLVGFVMSVLKTMYDLANPNMAILARLPDGQYRDIRNFPQAEVTPGLCVVRMDARLNFTNSRALKEFCLRAVQVREAKGEQVDHLILDCKPMNDVDLTGFEMLEVLAEELHGSDVRLILANVKGRVGKMLTLAHVPAVIKKYGGHTCIDMKHALAIVRKEDCGKAASGHFNTHLKNVDTSHVALKAALGTNPFSCSKCPPGKEQIGDVESQL